MPKNNSAIFLVRLIPIGKEDRARLPRGSEGAVGAQE